MSYVAKRKLKIDGEEFNAGDKVPVTATRPESRLKPLVGRFLCSPKEWEADREAEAEAAAGDDDAVNLTDLTADQLKAFADDLGIALPSKGNKAEWIKTIEDATAEAE